MTDSFKTYAVSLCFDKDSSEKVLSLQKDFSLLTENDYLVKNSVPAHITLGMFHAADGDVPELERLFSEFADGARRHLSLSFDGTDNFKGKVVFLKPAVDSISQLKELNAALHEKILSRFRAGGNQNYLPERYFPHIALAVKLTQEQFKKYEAWSQSSKATCAETYYLHLKIADISLAKCKPYKELHRINLLTDTLSAEQRHKNMSAIRSCGGKLETSLRSQLFKFGFRFRKNDRRLDGSPDIVFPHYKAVVFINGCFWHAHGWKSEQSILKSSVLEEDVLYSILCDKFRMPTTNTEFWEAKFTRNRKRDINDIEKLLEKGWRVGVVWECSITGRNRNDKIRSTAEKISLWLEEGFNAPFQEF